MKIVEGSNCIASCHYGGFLRACPGANFTSTSCWNGPRRWNRSTTTQSYSLSVLIRFLYLRNPANTHTHSVAFKNTLSELSTDQPTRKKCCSLFQKLSMEGKKEKMFSSIFAKIKICAKWILKTAFNNIYQNIFSLPTYFSFYFYQ